MTLQEAPDRGSGLANVRAQANLLLASPIRRPIDPARALAILVSETAEVATAGVDGLRQAAEAVAQELGETLRLP
jgi:hypothetical protein